MSDTVVEPEYLDGYRELSQFTGGIGESTLKRYVAEGLLPSVKIEGHRLFSRQAIRDALSRMGGSDET